MLAVIATKSGGDGWESNPPRTPQQRPANGFEDRGRHQPPIIPSARNRIRSAPASDAPCTSKPDPCHGTTRFIWTSLTSPSAGGRPEDPLRGVERLRHQRGVSGRPVNRSARDS